jgi:hypothetical protein
MPSIGAKIGSVPFVSCQRFMTLDMASDMPSPG